MKPPPFTPREPRFKARVGSTLGGKFVAMLDPPLSQCCQPSNVPHPSPRYFSSIDTSQGIGLETFDGLILGVRNHGVIDFHHVVRYRSDNSSIHLYQVLLPKAIVPEVSQDPISLPELLFQRLNVGLRCRFPREVPAKEFRLSDIHSMAVFRVFTFMPRSSALLTTYRKTFWDGIVCLTLHGRPPISIGWHSLSLQPLPVGCHQHTC